MEAAADVPSGVSIHMPGQLAPERRVEGWPNLVEVAALAQRHFSEICDPGHGYMAYVGACIGMRTPVFVRSLWDWVEAASYGLPGRIAARRLTGDTAGEEVEIGQRKLTLAAFHNLDGFAHRTYARGWSQLGFTRYKRRNYEGAEEALREAVALGYNKIETYYTFGLVLYYLERCEEAMPFFNQALAADPEEANALEGIRLCLEAEKEEGGQTP